MSARGAKRLALWLLGGVGVLVAGTIAAFVIAGDWTPEPPPKLAWTKGATWFTGPLTPDGSLDWTAAVKAEAVAAGWREERDGGAALDEALRLLTGVEETIRLLPGRGSDFSLSANLDDGLQTIRSGNFDLATAALVLPWLDHCAPVFERARVAAATGQLWVGTGDDGTMVHVDPYSRRFSALDDLIKALACHAVERGLRGETAAARESAVTAWRLASLVPYPASALDQGRRVTRQATCLELLLNGGEAREALPAHELFPLFDSPPDRLDGEAAMLEALRLERWQATMQLIHVQQRVKASDDIEAGDMTTAMVVFARADPNPLFRRLQAEFDRLEQQLALPEVPLAARFDAVLARLEELEGQHRPVPPQRDGPLGRLLVSDREWIDRFFVLYVASRAQGLEWGLVQWLHAVTRRDSLLAEAAARANAPERRDSLLGEPLMARQQADGSWQVSGALIELAKRYGLEEK